MITKQLQNLINDQLLNDMQLDFQIFKLRKVGRKNMSQLELWRSWIKS